MTIRKVFITVGPACSGKSTYSEKECDKNPNLRRVNMDDLRYMVTPNAFDDSEKFHKELLRMEYDIIRRLLTYEHDIIVDNTHIRLDRIERLINFLQNCADSINITITCIVVPMKDGDNLKLLRERNANRQRTVPDRILISQCNRLTKQGYVKDAIKLGHVTLTPREKYHNTPDLPKAIICDIDGTVADSTDIRFIHDLDKVHLDVLIEHTANALNSLQKQTGATLFFFSGREDVSREQTEAWLTAKGFDYRLLGMRKAGDYREDSIIKSELFDEFIRDEYHVIGVFDDRLQVCRLWHSLGLPLFRVGNPEDEK